jgi:hypothetical protein
MPMNLLHFDQGEAPATGAATGVAISVPAIRAGNRLIAVVAHDVSNNVLTAHNPGAFVVGAGTITSASINTSGQRLAILFEGRP